MIRAVNASTIVGNCRRCGDEYERRADKRDSSLCPDCRIRSVRCSVCGGSISTRRYRRCDRCIDARVTARARATLVDGHTRYADDVACQLFVAHFRGGASIYEIGDALGISGERVRQIEEVALRRLRARLRLVGLDVTDLMPSERAPHPLSGGR